MPDQFDLFATAARGRLVGRGLRDRGIRQVTENTPAPIRAEFERVACRIMADRGRCSINDINAVLTRPVWVHPNAWGAMMRTVATARGWRKAGIEQTEHSAGHARAVAVWAK